MRHSIWYRVGVLLTAFGLFGFPSAGGEPLKPVEVEGKVLASFDSDHAIISTGNKLIRFSTRRLSFFQRQKLERLPMKIKLRIPADAVDMVWDLQPEPEALAPVAKIESSQEALESLKSHDGIVEIVGRRLPSIPAETAFVQVRDMIYVIQKNKVPQESRERLETANVNAYIPQGSVLFSWKLEPGVVNDQQPSPGEIAKEGEKIRIVGKSLYSFEEPYSLVHANNSIVQLKRKDLSPGQRTQLDSIGNQVKLKVPRSTISYLWSVKPSRAPASAGAVQRP